MRRMLFIAVLGILGTHGVAQAQKRDDVVRVSAQIVGGVTGGTLGGFFGTVGGQALGEFLPGSPTYWTFAATALLHNVGTTWGASAASRLAEGRRVDYSEARKGVLIGQAAFVVYGLIVSPVLSKVGCGVGSLCGKVFGLAAYALPSIGASVAIERAR